MSFSPFSFHGILIGESIYESEDTIMCEMEYTEDRALRRQAWKLLLCQTLLSPPGIAAILTPAFLAVMGVYELRQAFWGFVFWGAEFFWYGWQTLGLLLLFWGTALWVVWCVVVGNRRGYQRFLAQPEGVRRLVLSQHMLRVYQQDGQQLLAIHWNQSIRLVQGRDLVLLCAGRSCVAAISARELEAQGGLAELQRTVNERVRGAQPLDETLWRSLITPRPGLVWAASYSAADAWKRRMGLRLVLVVAAALLIVLLLMPGGFWVKGISAAVVLVLLTLQATPRRREKNTLRRGGPAGLINMPARFELYEDGIQIARGEEGSFWTWDRIDTVQDQRDTLVLKKDKGIVTLLPPQAFADEAERRRVLEFIQSKVGAR